MFSERLKLARKRSGLSLRALSSAMGGIVSAQAIGKYERAEMMPSSTVAMALAEALEVPLSYLLSPSRVSLASVEFRKLASTRVRERAAVEGEVLDHVDRYLQVEEILGLDIAEQDGTEGAPYRVTALDDAEGQPLQFASLGILEAVRYRTLPSCWRSAASRCSSGACPVRWMGSVAGCAGSAGAMYPSWSAPPGNLSRDSGSRLLTNWATWYWISRPQYRRKKPASALPVHS